MDEIEMNLVMTQTIQYNYNFIDFRLVRLRDRDAGWKDGCLKSRVEHMPF